MMDHKGNKDNTCTYSGLNPCALGLAIGLVLGLKALILAYANMWFQVAQPMVDWLSSIYVGFKPTYIGGLIGFLWGLVDGFIFGFVFGFIYNKVLKCHACKICKYDKNSHQHNK